MKKLALFLILSCAVLSFAQYDYSWGLASNPYWISRGSQAARWIDTAFSDLSSCASSDVYKIITVVGDSSYLYADLFTYGFNMSGNPHFFMNAKVTINKLDLYSMAFIGLTSYGFATPYGNNGSTGIMVGFGRTYDGPIFGIYASNGTIYNSKDTVQTGLLSEGHSYAIVCSTSSSGSVLYAKLRDGCTNIALMTLQIPYTVSSYAYLGIDYFTAAMNGYQSDNGKGYATMRYFLDSLYLAGGDIATESEQKVFKNEEPEISISPNPFNPFTRIAVRMPQAEGSDDVTIEILNLYGKLIQKLPAARCSASGGPAEFIWDASAFPSGTYIAKAVIDGRVYSKALILLK
ncbi:MAG: hypothetical protein A2268_01970 [Candidatus Raymondbacteria bacterium RifOxyA12_full_50_37]|uniref:Secretion system C-terminal sorting domain-containing protein n=1 Tax=Candidatus Raymondbacteria bacterium RIFOXYD12_FULL_49_13 TaxID=1817890 RepID=A0A1F7F5U2_UNCRA|nr:MAG: hypothetical protein A2268_01970 [Candidatus Raymondbacteria bacterium RifOxyA12_full_50_37]OGJ92110.1 MAG: hypothetical protein A2248_10800 [Candidatus Raymondbacteria bacterium RIFOXYA2_FULL_49_16]OGJ93484.1 MAG: hypothetical protein A2487_20700 [Candidatus Raymondbacteria bacterium RifOxyC12_full_50_8]OGJ98466.1 MAG: hypothetical protein A2453_07040 [Candidatus Raymondbacteria bacterium RIFOXYC2_FULL_50_21]OGK00249.1 MAG: hypothetical protein A2350_05140 [Candidatus Raymondbacteria b